MSLRAVGSDPLIAPPFKRSGGMWACLPTAWQSVLLQKARVFKAFRLRIATPLFAFGKNADIGHSLQVLGDEGALELVRAFGRFAMTETNFVYSLTAPLTQGSRFPRFVCSRIPRWSTGSCRGVFAAPAQGFEYKSNSPVGCSSDSAHTVRVLYDLFASPAAKRSCKRIPRRSIMIPGGGTASRDLFHTFSSTRAPRISRMPRSCRLPGRSRNSSALSSSTSKIVPVLNTG